MRDWYDSADPIDIADPIENIDANDPALPMDMTEPTLPIDSTDPREPIDRIDLSDQNDHRDRVLACMPPSSRTARASRRPRAERRGGRGSFVSASLARAASSHFRGSSPRRLTLVG